MAGGAVLTCVAGKAPGAPLPPVREVRVLLADDASQVRLRCTEAVAIRDSRDERIGIMSAVDDGLVVWHAGAGRTLVAGSPYAADPLFFLSERGSPLGLSFQRDGAWTTELTYPGRVAVRRLDPGALEVVNWVELEAYVACVVANEVWPTFDLEAFRGQSIVARTFVLYQMTRRPDAVYDVYATQGSQVYRGLRDDGVGRKAKDAAEYTRGLALTWNDQGEDRLFCTYYSAACGGMSQSARPLGPEGDAAPLRGGIRCDYCKIAPGEAYRWGPVKLSLDEVTSRLLARYPELTALGALSAISPVEQTATGRLISLRLTGTSGATHDILAERFRLAIGATTLRSTDCSIRMAGQEVVFDRGKGFGHGLGLCQWGMQGLAQSGKTAGEILRFYYPGAKLTRVY